MSTGEEAMRDAGAQREPITDLRVVSARTAWNGVGQGLFVPSEWRSLAAALGLSPREFNVAKKGEGKKS